MRATATISLLLVLAAGALLPSSACADRGGGTWVDCPVCDKKKIYQPYSTTWPALGYYGKLGPQVKNLPTDTFNVWTCPHCRYSNWFIKFGKGVKPATKKRILAGLEAPAPLDERTGRLPTWARYDLAAQIFEWDGASPRDRGALLIAGAWAIRANINYALRSTTTDEALDPRFWRIFEAAQVVDHSVTVPAGEKLISFLWGHEATAATAERNAMDARKAGKPDLILDLVAACLHRQLGEYEAVKRVLARMEDPAAPATIREAAKGLVDSMSRERAFQERALALLLGDARAPVGTPGTRAWVRIAAADALRRLGRVQEATKLFLDAASDLEAPVWALPLVRHGLAKMGAKEKIPALLASAETRARDALRKQLVDPSSARAAACLIGDLAEPAFFPDLIAAIAHPNGHIRTAALMALHRMKVLAMPPAVIEALGRVFLNKEVSDWNRRSALSCMEGEASPASLPLFRAALDDGNHDIRGNAVDGLIRCGEAQDVPRLLAFLEREEDAVEWFERRNVLRALVSLANRDFSSAQDAATWWQSAKGRSREDWVLEGFRAAGIEIARPLSLKSVPALLKLLDVGRQLDQPWVVWNAHRTLRALTGQRFGWNLLTSVWSTKEWRKLRKYKHKGRPLWVDQWHTWWASQQATKQKPPK